MAETISNVVNTVMGNYRVVVQNVTQGANSATADVPTGLNFVEFATYQEYKAGAHMSIVKNQTVAGTATLGTVALTSGTSAGSGQLISYGY